MKIGKYLQWLSLIVLVLLLWQWTLIMMAVVDLLKSIETSLFEIESNRIEPKSLFNAPSYSSDLENIQLVNVSDQQFSSSVEKIYPDYKINLWIDERIEEIILTKDYFYLYPVHKSCLYEIQRADLARLVVLHSQGGIYADFEVFSSDRNIEELRSRGASLIIARSPSNICLINHFLVAERNSSLINYILHQVHRKSFSKQIFVLPYLEVFSTGSIFLNNALRKRTKVADKSNDRSLILSSNHLSQFIKHEAGRSWHLIDGYLINQIDAHPTMFLNFSAIILLGFCLIKLKRYFRTYLRF